ncbi:MAG: 50S ribosomal protein L25 [Candidatus Sungbacteria bacterium]|nr:50S ribosomal protein L25 [Candidatus Sungbacteria bacterium]
MQQLAAKSRNQLGKSVKTLRKSGFLPAVVYGEGVPSQPVAILYKDFVAALHTAGESTLVTLDVDGKPFNVLIHDISYDPVSDLPIHADFHAVRMDKVIRTHVPLAFVGESSAVKNDAGVLIRVVQELEVEALPQNLPHELRVDLSLLEVIGSTIHVKNITLPEGVTVIAALDETIAVVEAPRSEEDIAALSQAPVETSPELVKTERDELKAKEQEKKEAEEAAAPAGK